MQTDATVLLGLLFGAIVVLAWATLYDNKFKEFPPEVILLCAMMSVALMPFYFPQGGGWLLALGYQLTSGLTYSIYMVASVMPIDHLLVRNLLFSALFVNIALLGYIFSNRWKLHGVRKVL